MFSLLSPKQQYYKRVHEVQESANFVSSEIAKLQKERESLSKPGLFKSVDWARISLVNDRIINMMAVREALIEYKNMLNDLGYNSNDDDKDNKK